MTKYTDLITSEHANKPKFVAAVAATTQPFLDIQATLLGLIEDFDLDQAVGVQLDAVGRWVGIARTISTPLVGVYFSWGAGGPGWSQGLWKGPFDPSTGLTTLTDDYYRLVIRSEIALNNWDGTMAPAVAAIAPLFPANNVYIQDNFNMSISVTVSGPALDPVSAALLTGGYLALKATTVGIKYYFPSGPSGPVFGWGVDNGFIGGWGDSTWGSSSPWVSDGSQLLATDDSLALVTELGTFIEVAA